MLQPDHTSNVKYRDILNQRSDLKIELEDEDSDLIDRQNSQLTTTPSTKRDISTDYTMTMGDTLRRNSLATTEFTVNPNTGIKKKKNKYRDKRPDYNFEKEEIRKTSGDGNEDLLYGDNNDTILNIKNEDRINLDIQFETPDRNSTTKERKGTSGLTRAIKNSPNVDMLGDPEEVDWEKLKTHTLTFKMVPKNNRKQIRIKLYLPHEDNTDINDIDTEKLQHIICFINKTSTMKELIAFLERSYPHKLLQGKINRVLIADDDGDIDDDFPPLEMEQDVTNLGVGNFFIHRNFDKHLTRRKSLKDELQEHNQQTKNRGSVDENNKHVPFTSLDSLIRKGNNISHSEQDEAGNVYNTKNTTSNTKYRAPSTASSDSCCCFAIFSNMFKPRKKDTEQGLLENDWMAQENQNQNRMSDNESESPKLGYVNPQIHEPQTSQNSNNSYTDKNVINMQQLNDQNRDTLRIDQVNKARDTYEHSTNFD